MKYLILVLLFLSACTDKKVEQLDFTGTTYSVTSAPDCPPSVLNSKEGFERMQGDHGAVMYFSTKNGDMCLDRRNMRVK